MSIGRLEDEASQHERRDLEDVHVKQSVDADVELGRDDGGCPSCDFATASATGPLSMDDTITSRSGTEMKMMASGSGPCWFDDDDVDAEEGHGCSVDSEFSESDASAAVAHAGSCGQANAKASSTIPHQSEHKSQDESQHRREQDEWNGACFIQRDDTNKSNDNLEESSCWSGRTSSSSLWSSFSSMRSMRSSTSSLPCCISDDDVLSKSPMLPTFATPPPPVAQNVCASTPTVPTVAVDKQHKKAHSAFLHTFRHQLLVFAAAFCLDTIATTASGAAVLVTHAVLISTWLYSHPTSSDVKIVATAATYLVGQWGQTLVGEMQSQYPPLALPGAASATATAMMTIIMVMSLVSCFSACMITMFAGTEASNTHGCDLGDDDDCENSNNNYIYNNDDISDDGISADLAQGEWQDLRGWEYESMNQV